MLEYIKLKIAFYTFLAILGLIAFSIMFYAIKKWGEKEKEKEIFKEKYSREIHQSIKNLSDEEKKEVLFIINEIISEKKDKSENKFIERLKCLKF